MLNAKPLVFLLLFLFIFYFFIFLFFKICIFEVYLGCQRGYMERRLAS
jgi:hypothetical protein